MSYGTRKSDTYRLKGQMQGSIEASAIFRDLIHDRLVAVSRTEYGVAAEIAKAQLQILLGEVKRKLCA